MSQAFLKEGDGDSEESVPDRPISPLPNYVTPDGLRMLEDEVRRLGELRTRLAGEPERHKNRKLKEAERDLRYFEKRLETAVKIDPASLDRSQARIGALVELELEGGKRLRFRIVGEDQADGQTLLCWASPMASAVLGIALGGEVAWEIEDAPARARLIALSYPAAPDKSS